VQSDGGNAPDLPDARLAPLFLKLRPLEFRHITTPEVIAFLLRAAVTLLRTQLRPGRCPACAVVQVGRPGTPKFGGPVRRVSHAGPHTHLPLSLRQVRIQVAGRPLCQWQLALC
jgi:hypothetical protein